MLFRKEVVSKVITALILFSTIPLVSLGALEQVLEVNSPHTTITQTQGKIIEQQLLQKKYREAISYIENELIKDPKNTKLLYKKAGIETDIEDYSAADETLSQIFTLEPTNAEANKLREKIQAILLSIPKNELGFNWDESYVSDIGRYWQYASLHYYRYTNSGTFGGRVNYANRYGTTGEQYQLEAFPTFSKGYIVQYINLSLAYANFTQILFPNYQYTIEPYFTLPNNFELSAGLKGLKTRGTNIYNYTGSIAYIFGNNYAWFRPNHFTPKSSDFFEVGIRHYFYDDKNTFLSVKAGLGKAPDILDLAPLDQIVVLKQKLFAVNGQFPLHKNVYLQAGAGYLWQEFPSGRLRQITDGSLGLMWLF